MSTGSAHYRPARLPVKPRGMGAQRYFLPQAQSFPSAFLIARATSSISAMPSTIFSLPEPR